MRFRIRSSPCSTRAGTNSTLTTTGCRTRTGRKLSISDLAPGFPREAAIIDTLGPGIYTVVERGANHSEGRLDGIYDLFDGLELSAVGTRAFVSTGDDVMLSGIIIIGTDPLPLLIRVLGPSLADVGLKDVLPDPTLELVMGTDLIASNDNWKDTQQQRLKPLAWRPATISSQP